MPDLQSITIKREETPAQGVSQSRMGAVSFVQLAPPRPVLNPDPSDLKATGVLQFQNPA